MPCQDAGLPFDDLVLSLNGQEVPYQVIGVSFWGGGFLFQGVGLWECPVRMWIGVPLKVVGAPSQAVRVPFRV